MSTLAKYPKATTITIYSLGIFLGLLHVLFGVIALSPMINQDYHREMKINYNAFSKNLSFLHSFVDRAQLAVFLRYFLAASQIIFGALLAENGHFGLPAKVGNYGLVAIDIVFLLFQLLAKSSLERIAPTVVFSVLLVTRLLIIEQSSKRTKVGVKTRSTGKPKSSTPKKNKNE